MREHFQYILDSLQVGMEDDSRTEPPFEVEVSLPPLLPEIPPVSVRAVVVLDGHPYEVYIKAVEAGEAHEPRTIEAECPKSTHGKHTPVDGKCIGCGETVS